MEHTITVGFTCPVCGISLWASLSPIDLKYEDKDNV